jgi:hypothetical protein
VGSSPKRPDKSIYLIEPHAVERSRRSDSFTAILSLLPSCSSRATWRARRPRRTRRQPLCRAHRARARVLPRAHGRRLQRLPAPAASACTKTLLSKNRRESTRPRATGTGAARPPPTARAPWAARTATGETIPPTLQLTPLHQRSGAAAGVWGLLLNPRGLARRARVTPSHGTS